jgi:hypothetical protein
MEWGFEERRPLPSQKFKDYGGLAVTYLVLIQRRLTNLEGFDEKYPGLFRSSFRMSGTNSADRISQIPHTGKLDDKRAKELRDEIQRINQGSAAER